MDPEAMIEDTYHLRHDKLYCWRGPQTTHSHPSPVGCFFTSVFSLLDARRLRARAELAGLRAAAGLRMLSETHIESLDVKGEEVPSLFVVSLCSVSSRRMESVVARRGVVTGVDRTAWPSSLSVFRVPFAQDIGHKLEKASSLGGMMERERCVCERAGHCFCSRLRLLPQIVVRNRERPVHQPNTTPTHSGHH